MESLRKHLGVLLFGQPRHDQRQIEDALKHLRGYEEAGLTATAESLAGALHLSQADARALVNDLNQRGLIRPDGLALRLTPQGEEQAREIVRAHRLWERYLADEAGIGLAELHALAERREHTLDQEVVEALEEVLAYPRIDPHGDVIPSAAGALPLPAVPLNTCQPGQMVRVVHVEDDDPVILRTLLAAGILPGTQLEIIAETPAEVSLRLEGRTVRLPALAAGAATVAPTPPPMARLVPLSVLRPGETGIIAALASRGLTRRRFLDLGLVPGTPITAEMRAALGEPTAYRVRGTLLALRPEQANQILIEETVSRAPAGSDHRETR